LQITIRPNLLFTVNLLSQFAANPRKTYSEVIKYTLAYIKKTIKYKITYYNDTSLQLVSFVNSNYTNDCNMWRLTNRHFFYIRGEPISWSTKRQKIVTTFITKVEYIIVSLAV